MIGTALLAAALFGLAVALVVRGLSMPRVRTVRQLQSIAAYGFSGATVSDPAFEDDPRLVSRIGATIARRLKRERLQAMRRQLLGAGLHTTSVETYLGYYAVAAAGLTLLGLWFALITHASPAAAVIWILAGAALGWMLPRFALARRARLRLEKIDYEIPELVDLLLVGVESGMGFNGAMRVASTRVTGPLGEELRLMLQQQSLGASTTEALENMLDRGETPALRSFVRTITQGERLGVSIGQMMRTLADEMRKRRKALAEERAQKTPVKIIFPLACTLLPALIAVVLTPVVINIIDTFNNL